LTLYKKNDIILIYIIGAKKKDNYVWCCIRGYYMSFDNN